MTCYKLMQRFFLITLFILSLCSCSMQNKSNTDDAQDGPLAADDVDIIEEKEPEKPMLHFSTPEEAMAYMDGSDQHDKYAKGILYQMANDSLDYCTRLLNNSYDYFIIVDKGDMHVKLYDRYGVLIHSYLCAAGKGYGNKHGKGDCRTPEGFFKAGSVKNSTDWHYTDENGHRSENPGQYGPRFIRIVTPGFNSTGIHGTDAPWSVGGRRSHGCVRIKNENILQLAKYVQKGMPIIVLPGEKDKEVNWREAHPELFHSADSVKGTEKSAEDSEKTESPKATEPAKDTEPTENTEASKKKEQSKKTESSEKSGSSALHEQAEKKK